MIIEETEICWPFRVVLDGNTINLRDIDNQFEVCMCKTQAEQFLPVLQHFIATGELPE